MPVDPDMGRERLAYMGFRLSLRSMQAGLYCTDIDGLEYRSDLKGAAIIEVKWNRVRRAKMMPRPQYHALTDLAQRSGLPLYLVTFTSPLGDDGEPSTDYSKWEFHVRGLEGTDHKSKWMNAEEYKQFLKSL